MVSIVIPYYNRPKKLQRALNSIMNQSYKDFEIIIIDDASDKPFEVSLSKNLNYIRCNENKGPGAARNIGLNIAQGEYVIFLDSDDYWHESFLDKVIKALERDSSVIMGYANGHSVDANGIIIEELRKDVIKSNKILPSVLQHGRPWFTSACIWRKEMIKNIEWLETRAWEDYAFDVSAAVICNQIIKIDEYLMFYDASGVDKLSNQNPYTTAIEKNGSINYISESIMRSSFFKDKIIKKQIVKLLLNNTIALLVNNVKNYKLYSNNIYMLKIYRGFFLSTLVFIFIHINNKVGLSLLRRLRNRILS